MQVINSIFLISTLTTKTRMQPRLPHMEEICVLTVKSNRDWFPQKSV